MMMKRKSASPACRLAAAVACLGLAAVGCGGEAEDGPPVHPVSGTIFVDGAPAAGAEVVFHPLARLPAGTPPPTAVVEADGRFRPSTRTAHDGAPAGDYAVTVVYPLPAALPDDEGGGGTDRLRGRYGTPGRTPLKAAVKPGDNVLDPIEISTRSKGKR
jgi:hypothetical protein